MILRTPDGTTSFELHVVGYQFPGEPLADYDSNWLLIRIAVTHPRGSWSRTDPSLLTYEVQRLATWLHDVASGLEVDSEESFLEPNLAFELMGRPPQTLRITFRLEFSPPWADRRNHDERAFVELPIDSPALRRAAASLLGELRQFPQRAAR